MASPAFAFQGLSLSGVGPSTGSGDFSIGYRFQVGASDISVNSLGFLDVEQDGLQTAHNVGLYNDAGAQLSQVSVDSGTSAPLIGFFRFATITPITLTAGQIYRVAGSFQFGTDAFASNLVITNDPAITVLNQLALEPGPTLAFPTNLSATTVGGADIQFTSAATAVPFEFEPTAGLAILGGGWLLRKHLKKKATKV